MLSHLSLLLLALTVTEIGGLTWLAPLDAVAMQEISAWRSCSLDHAMFLMRDRPLMALIACGVIGCLWLCLRRRWQEAFHLVIIVVTGAFLCELLKTGIERIRPSALPSVTTGNSFPSGHVTTACLLAGTLGFVLWHERRRSWWPTAFFALLCLLVGAVVWQRLYFGHHWLSDILGSLLLASAWLSFMCPRPRFFASLPRTALLTVSALAMYLGFYFHPALRLALPTAHSSPPHEMPSTIVFTFGKNKPQAGLHGPWGADTQEWAGPATWLTREEAGIEVTLPQLGDYHLDLTIRPHLPPHRFACFPLELKVNRHSLGPLFLYRGWRQYTLTLDKQWLTTGRNTLLFRVGDEFPSDGPAASTVAFHQLRLFPVFREP